MRRTLRAWFATAACALWLAPPAAAQSVQIADPNVNMVRGVSLETGDPFLQRQNEGSLAISTRNPCHLLASGNDYKTVDIADGLDLPGQEPALSMAGDAWIGVYKSFDCGAKWSNFLLPGFPQDTSAAGLASPNKGFEAAADGVVRAMSNGVFVLGGMAFNRTKAVSQIFSAWFIDNNNKERGDTIQPLHTTVLDRGTLGQFLDKPWIAVDVPRTGFGPGAELWQVSETGEHANPNAADTAPASGECTITSPLGGGGTFTQKFRAGNAYMAWARFTGDGTPNPAKLMFARTTDCGKTWQVKPISSNQLTSQGATIAIAPHNGTIHVAWRQFGKNGKPHAIYLSTSTDGGKSFSKPTAVIPSFTPFDQPKSSGTFRTNSLPSITADHLGNVYVVVTARGYATELPDGSTTPVTTDDARIIMAVSRDSGKTFGTPYAIDNPARRGHQVMPSITFAAGKLQLLYYDFREDLSKVYQSFVSDNDIVVPPQPKEPVFRHTVDVMSAHADPGGQPVFTAQQISQYRRAVFRDTGTGGVRFFAQANPPNVPIFACGDNPANCRPFVGDYIDIAGLSSVPVPTGTGTQWVPNVGAGGGTSFLSSATSAVGPFAPLPIFHASWTDNRDVKPPRDGFSWHLYQKPGSGIFQVDPDTGLPNCSTAGMRNQNLYTARLTPGLFVGSPQNTKPLGKRFNPETNQDELLQRGFVVFLQNTRRTGTAFYRLTIVAPPNVLASWRQFDKNGPTTTIDVRVPGLATLAKTLFARSEQVDASFRVDVVELNPPAGTPPVLTIKEGGLRTSVAFNADKTTPPIVQPDFVSADVPEIAVAEAHDAVIFDPLVTAVFKPGTRSVDIKNPGEENPGEENPGEENPGEENPGEENPGEENPGEENPGEENAGVINPGEENPGEENPGEENPGEENTAVENTALSDAEVSGSTIQDIQWKVSNKKANTHTAYVFSPVVADQAPDLRFQVIVTKRYYVPALNPTDCSVGVRRVNEVISNISNFKPRMPGEENPGEENPGEENPGEENPGEENPGEENPGEENVAATSFALNAEADQPRRESVVTFVFGPGESGTVTLRTYDLDPEPVPEGADPTRPPRDILPIDVETEVAATVTAQAADTGDQAPASASAGPDLITSEPMPVLSPATTTPGGSVSLAWTLKNAGTSEAISSGETIKQRAYLSTDAILSPDDRLLQASNESTVFTTPSPLPACTTETPTACTRAFQRDLIIPSSVPCGLEDFCPLAPGTYFVIIVADDDSDAGDDDVGADPDSEVFEADDFNNFAAVALDVQPFTTAFAGPVLTAPAGGPIESTSPVRVNVFDSLGQPASPALVPEVTIALGTNPTGGVLSGTVTRPNIDGVATFDDLSIDLPGVGYTLRATAPRTTETTSNAFQIDGVPVALADAYATDEDQILTAATSVLANDTDLEGASLKAHLATAPLNGTVDLISAGTFTYTPNPNFFGVDTFTYRAGDGRSLSAPATVTIAVAPVNDDPIALDDEAFVVPNTGPNTVLTLENDSSPDPGETLTVTAVTQPANGSSAIAPGGQSVTYQPNEGFAGADSFSYTVDDGTGRTASAKIHVTVHDGGVATFVVTNANDSGPGSLRQAILNANRNVEQTDTITFNMFGAGVIRPATPLPTVTDAVIIDATTQPGYEGAPLVELNGTLVLGIGLNLTSGNSTVRALSITGFQTGILVSATNNTIEGCYVGVDLAGLSSANSTGIQVVDSFGDLIGGATAAARNTISGNQTGIVVGPRATSIRIQGNYIGTSPDGMRPSPNLGGISINEALGTIIGGSGTGEGNLISGNHGPGIALNGVFNSRAVIKGNLIGTDATGAAPLPNTMFGIFINGSPENIIGGTQAGDGNVIAFNGGPGVAILTASANLNAISHNSITGNAGLGIDLGNDGVTPNGGDEQTDGPNRLQRFPDLDRAIARAGGTEVRGFLASLPFRNVRIDFYANPSCEAGDSLHGEGERWLGSLDITATDQIGSTPFTTLVAAAAPGEFITATATDFTFGEGGTGDTSEFSLCRQVAANTAPVAVDDTTTTGQGAEVFIDVLANDADGDGDALLVGSITPPVNGGTATGAGSDRILYTPAPGFAGTDTFTYTATDGTSTSGFATVTVTVNGGGGEGPGQALTATDDEASAFENGSVTINVLANDSDPDGVLVASHSFSPSATPVNVPFPGDLVVAPQSGLVYMSGAFALGVYDQFQGTLLRGPEITGGVNLGKANPATGILYYRSSSGLLGVDARPGSSTFNQLITMPSFPGKVVLSFAIDHVRGRLYVGLGTPNSGTPFEIAIIDVGAGRELTPQIVDTIPLPQSGGIRSIAANTRTGSVYVAGGGVLVIRDGASVATLIPNTTFAHNVAVNETFDLVYAGGQGGAGMPPNLVMAIDGQTNTLLANISVSDRVAQGEGMIAVHQTTGRVLVRLGVTSTQPGSLAIIDGHRSSGGFNTVIGAVPLGSGFGQIAIDDHANVGVATNNTTFANAVQVIDLATNEVVLSLPSKLGASDVAINPHTHHAFAGTVGGLVMISTASRSVITSEATGTDQGTIALNPATRTAYIPRTTLEGTAIEFVRADGTRGTIAGPHENGRYIFVAADTNQQRIYAANANADVTGTDPTGPGFLTIIDATDNRVMANVPAGIRPFGLAVDESANKIYVANLSAGPTAPGGITIVDGAAPHTAVAADVSAFHGPNSGQVAGFGRDIVVGPTGKVYARVTSGQFANGVGVLNPGTHVVTPLPASLGDVRIIRSDALPRNRIFLGAIRTVDGTQIHEVIVLDGATDAEIGRREAGFPGPLIGTGQYMAIDTTRNLIYVTDYNSRALHIISGETLEITGSIGFVARPIAVAIDQQANRVYVTTDERGLLIVDGFSGGGSHVNVPLIGAMIALDAASNTVFIGSANPEPGVMVISDSPAVRFTTLTVTPDGESANGATLQVNPDQTITFTPHPFNFGLDTFNYTLTDSNGGTSTATVRVRVVHPNHGPRANDDTFVTDEDALFVPPDNGVLENDFDDDHASPSSFQVSLVRDTRFGTLVLSPSGSFSYTPRANFHGNDSFVYRLADSLGGHSQATATIVVRPVADGDGGVGNVGVGPWDPAVFRATVGAGVGPAENLTADTGSDFMFVKSRDATGSRVGLAGFRATAPDLTPVAYDVRTSSWSGVLFDPVDPGTYSASIPFQIISSPIVKLRANGAADVVGTLGYTFDPFSADAGQIQFARSPSRPGIYLWDNTTARALRLDTGTGAVTEMAELDQANDPGFHNTTKRNDIAFDEQTGTLLIADGSTNSILEARPGDTPLTLFSGLPGPPSAIAVDDKTGKVFFAVGPAIYGGSRDDHAFELVAELTNLADLAIGRASSGSGQSLYALANGQLFELRWTAAAPIAQNDAITVPEGAGPIALAVLANDFDLSGAPLTIVSFTQPESGGTVGFGSDRRTLLFTPTMADFSGSATFSYTVAGFGASATATVVVTFVGINDSPIALNNTFQTARDTQLNVAAPGVLANDTDADGPSALTAQLVDKPTSGELVLNPDGSFFYAPAPGFVGNDTFTYRAFDGVTASGTATVTINVTAPLAITTSQLREGVLFESYFTPLQTSGGRLPVTFGIGDDSNPLPENLQFIGNSIRTPFTPDVPSPRLVQTGAFDFWVKATDSSVPIQQTTQRRLTMRISAADQALFGEPSEDELTFGAVSGRELAQVLTTGVRGAVSAVRLNNTTCPAGTLVTVELQGVTGTQPARPNGVVFAQGSGAPGFIPIQFTDPHFLAVESPAAVVVRASPEDCTVRNVAAPDWYTGGEAFVRTGAQPWQTLFSQFGKHDLMLTDLVMPTDVLYSGTWRNGHTATKLADGRVLLAGGGSFGSELGDVYDPETGRITPTANALDHARWGATATLLPNGKVLVVGGSYWDGTQTVFLDTAMLFDPTTNEFAPLAARLNVGRDSHTATLLADGRVLIVGGARQNTNGFFEGVGTVEAFDGATFTVVAERAQRWEHTATLLQSGKVLVAGGYWSGSEPADAEVFDPATNTFAATAGQLPRGRGEVTATLLLDGRVLIAGGGANFPALAASYFVYQPSTDTFVDGGPMAVPRLRHTATLLPDGTVLVAGGIADWYQGQAIASMERYTPNPIGSAQPGSAAGAGSMRVTRQDHTATLLNHGDVLIGAGWSRSDLTARSAELYHTAFSTFAIATTTLPDGSVNVPYATTVLQTTGGATPVEFSVIAGALPNGLVLELNGTIHGTPTAAGSMSFVVRALSSSPVQSTEQRLTITIDRLVITTAAPPTGTVGVPYNAQLEATGVGAKTWALDCCAPFVPGLTFNGDGSITGTPTTAGFYFFRARATDSIGQVAVRDLTLEVTQPLAFAITGDATEDATVFWWYGFFLQAVGGRFPYEWSITEGAPPPGVTLQPWGGFNGNVEETGNFAFTARVQDASTPRQMASAAMTIRSGSLDQNNGITDTGAEQWVTIDGSQTVAQTIRNGLEGSLLNVQFVVECTSGDLIVRALHVDASGHPDHTRPIAANALPGTRFPVYTDFRFLRQVKLFTAVPVPLDAPLAITLTSTGSCRVAKTQANVDYAYGRGFVGDGVTFTPIGGTDATRDDFAFHTIVHPAGEFTWTLMGRSSHTATTLPNGEILLAGGSNFGATAVTYDPATKRYTPTANEMSARRYNHTATLLQDGRVFIAGGQDPNGGSIGFGTAEIYDPATRRFTPVSGGMTQLRFSHTATLLPNGTVLLAGGNIEWVQPPVASAEVFDPIAGTFNQVGDMSGGRIGHTATLLPDGSVLLAGGWGTATTARAERYVPGTGFVGITNNTPRHRVWHTATTVPCPAGVAGPGCVLVAGGWDVAGGQPASRAEVYELAGDRFVDVGQLAQGRQGHTATALPDSSVVLIGGDDSNGIGNEPFASVERYDPATGNFSPLQPLKMARRHHTVSPLADGRLLVMGGYGRSNNSWNSGELYTPAAAPLMFATGQLPDGAVGQPYNASVQAIGTAPPFSYAVTFGALPPGIIFDGGTGLLGGFPSALGSFSFTIEAADSAAPQNRAWRSFQITIGEVLTITAVNVPNGTLGQPYDYMLEATGGVGARTWAVSGGTLPPGMFVTASGQLTGTPTEEGTFHVTVSVRDSSSPPQSDTQNFSVTVESAAQAPLMTVGTTDREEGVSIARASGVNGTGFVVLSDRFGSQDVWVKKFDQEGNLLWQNRFDGGRNDGTALTPFTGRRLAKGQIIQLASGGYVVATTSESFGAGDQNAWLIKLDPNGEVVWQQAYGTANSDAASGVVELSDGSLIVVGSSALDGYDGWLLKVSSSGALLQQSRFGGVQDDFLSAIAAIPNTNDVAVTGWTFTGGVGGEALAVRLGPNLEMKWMRVFGSDGFDAGFGITASETRVTIAGTMNGDALVTTFDALNGDPIWQRTYGDTNDVAGAESIVPDSAGGFVFAGFTGPVPIGPGSQDNRAWMVRLGPSGEVRWQKMYAGAGQEVAGSVVQMADSSFLAAGYTNSFGADSTDVLLISMPLDGNAPACPVRFDTGAPATPRPFQQTGALFFGTAPAVPIPGFAPAIPTAGSVTLRGCPAF